MVEQISDTLTRIQLKDREILLVGTAHISKGSVDEVRDIIADEKPDRVCVEIDEGRYSTLKNGQDWSKLNIGQVLKQKKGFLMMANLVLSSFQRRLGLDIGITPGSELKEAIKAAEEANIPFTFVDRDIQVTLRRAWGLSNFWNKNKLLAALISSAFTNEKLSEEEIESLKNKSAIEGMMDELADYLPSVKKVLIDERDQYLAASIYKAQGKKIVAVIGAGHAKGIIQWLEEIDRGEKSADIEEIKKIPPPSLLSKSLPFLIPILVFGLFTVGFFTKGWEEVVSMFKMWVIFNGAFSAIGGILALAHPITILVSIIAAPITSLNPTIGVGLITGPLQAYLRKPRVKDFETLHQDIEKVSGFYKNRFTHALLVFILTSLGSAIGTFIGIPYLGSLLN